MIAIVPDKLVQKQRAEYVEFVVPNDVAVSTFVYDPNNGYGPTTFSQYVDSYLTPDINSMYPGARIVQWPSKHGARAIHVCLTTSALLASAPTFVQTLAAVLATDLPEAYAVHSLDASDTWLVAKNAEALRHACADFMRRIGVRYYAPHPIWKDVPKHNPSLVASEVVRPTIRDYFNAGNGGLGAANAQDAGVAPGFSAADENWYVFWAANRIPREFAGTGFGDGDESFIGINQCDLRHDRTMLAWDTGSGKRGFCSGGSFGGNFPTTCYNNLDGSIAVASKVQYTHHGPPGGTYPVAPAGPSPWAGATYPTSGCTVIPNVPCSLSPDANPDTITDPYPTEYHAFGGLVKLHCQHHVNYAFARLAQYGQGHPYTRFVSVEPNDGGGHCHCNKCRDLLRNGPYSAYLTSTQQTQDASDSDTIFHLANENAKYLAYAQSNAVFTSAHNRTRPGLFAYDTHADVPSIPLHPDLLVVLLTEGFASNLTTEQLQAAWIARRTTNPLGAFDLGIQPTWLISSTNVDAPKLSPRYTSARFKYWASNNILCYEGQSTYSSMVFGMHHWINLQQCWDPTLDSEVLLNEWFSCFGPATVAVRSLYERWWAPFFGVPALQENASAYEHSGQEIAEMWQACIAAQAALDAAPDATYQQRFDHFRAFIWFQQLAVEYATALAAYTAAVNGTTIANLGTASDAFLFCLWCVKPWNIVHAERHAQKVYNRLDPSLTALITKWNPLVSSGATGFSTVSTRTKAQLDALVTAGASAYPPRSGASRVTFNPKLVRLTTSNDATDVRFPTDNTAQAYQFIKGSSDVTFIIEQLGVNPGFIPATQLDWCRLDGTVIQSFFAQAVNSVSTNTMITLSGQTPDTYLLRVLDSLGISQQLQLHAPVSQPITQVGRIACTREFDVARLCWFYVPLGTTKIYMTYRQKAGHSIQFYQPDGATTQATTHDAGYGYYCTVPSGKDGQPWAFTGLSSLDEADGVHFENCPSALAYDKAQLMVPAGLDGHN